VNNRFPSATLEAPAIVNEGSPFTVSLIDPIDPSPADTAAGFTYAFDRGDGAGYGAFGASPSVSTTAGDNGTLLVRAKVRDKDGGATEFASLVTIGSVAPTVSAGGDANLLVGQPFSRAGSFADPSADSWSATVDYGDGGGVTPLPLNADKT